MALDNRFSDDKYEEGVSIIRKAANINGIQKTLADFELDVIIGPMDGRIPTIAAAAGAPVGTMPLGYSTTKLSNGRPFGVCIIAAAGQEDKIIRAMSAWDATMEKRKPPPQLYDPFNNRDELQRGPLVTVGIM
jgi:amidase